MYVQKLLNAKNSVFSTRDLQNLFEIEDTNYLYVLLNRMVEQNNLTRLYKGVYTYTENYNKWELANKLKQPSYISLETILYTKGGIFQTYENTVTSVGSSPTEVNVADTLYTFQQIKDDILMNPEGIVNDGVVVKASVERALCDRLYLTPNYYLDNTPNMDKEKLLKIVQSYPKRVQREVAALC